MSTDVAEVKKLVKALNAQGTSGSKPVRTSIVSSIPSGFFCTNWVFETRFFVVLFAGVGDPGYSAEVEQGGGGD